jgi:YlmC/YmxH family sporulation protein
VRLSDLQNKDIINIDDGKKIGNIIDMRIDEQGTILSLIVEPTKRFFKVFSSREEMEVKWSNIDKIGEDVILVKMVF